MKCSDFLRELYRNGWFAVRQNGSHIILEHPIIKTQIIFPNHGSRELGKGLEMGFRKIAGLK
ncbi:MAG: type II toxin-antitoxin system HicA family toxin [Bacteroidota bacterium]